MSRVPLEPNEKVLMICHKHWWVHCAIGLPLLLLFFLPYISYRLLDIVPILEKTAFTTILSSGNFESVALFLYCGWFLLLWAYFFVLWTNIYLDVWIITDRRIIDIEQISLFHRDISDFRLERIQNITVEERGLLANMFGYGNIHIETAGETANMRIDFIPSPTTVRDLISHHHDLALTRLELSSPTTV